MALKPQRLFIGLAIIIALFALIRTLIWGKSTIDIPLYDTFYIVPTTYVALIIVVLILLTAFIYWVGKKYYFNYNKWLTLGHFISSLLLLFNCIKLAYISPLIPRRYFSFNTYNPYESINYVNKLILIFSLLFLLFFILNLFIGFIKRQLKP